MNATAFTTKPPESDVKCAKLRTDEIMLKTQVIAYGIEHLTDARYFAARGANYLLYDLKRVSLSHVAVIQQWVSGVKSIILHPEVATNHEWLQHGRAIQLFGTIDEPTPVDLAAPAEVIQSIRMKYPDPEFFERAKADKIYILEIDVRWMDLSPSDRALYLELATQHRIFLYSSDGYFEIASKIDTYSAFGLILRGSPEEQPGMKVYNDLDDVFNLLEI